MEGQIQQYARYIMANRSKADATEKRRVGEGVSLQDLMREREREKRREIECVRLRCLVCKCVCMRERERESVLLKERKIEREKWEE